MAKKVFNKFKSFSELIPAKSQKPSEQAQDQSKVSISRRKRAKKLSKPHKPKRKFTEYTTLNGLLGGKSSQPSHGVAGSIPSHRLAGPIRKIFSFKSGNSTEQRLTLVTDLMDESDFNMISLSHSMSSLRKRSRYDQANPQHVASLQDFQRKAVEVLRRNDVPNSQTITTLIHALTIDPGHVIREYRDLLFEKFIEYEGQLTAQHYAMSLYGLYGQDPEASKKIIAKLKGRLAKCDEQFTAQQCAMSIKGIRFHDINEIDSILDFLIDQIANISFSDPNDDQTKYLLNIIKELSYMGYILEQHGIKKETLNQLIVKLREPYEKSIEPIQGKFANDAERDTYESLMKSPPAYNIDNNIYIDGIECDLLIPELKLNIEIDGGHHQFKKREDDLRDKYLLDRHGIRTERTFEPDVDSTVARIRSLIEQYSSEQSS